MVFQLRITTDNAAFGDDDYSAMLEEVGRILVRLGKELRGAPCGDSGNLFDLNGNKVGKWELLALVPSHDEGASR
jgi:hypothetical protein